MSVDIELAPGAKPRKGTLIHLVRWMQFPTGEWSPQTLAGRFVDLRDGCWVIERAGDEVELPTDQWSRFAD
ncbi:hypothetical protein [Leifsonia xyli]|uniref:hypothetical protein n=1 Tax=Leifsonia xyli TaxID=1575 RepID=UPI003D66D0CC